MAINRVDVARVAVRDRSLWWKGELLKQQSRVGQLTEQVRNRGQHTYTALITAALCAQRVLDDG